MGVSCTTNSFYWKVQNISTKGCGWLDMFEKGK